LVGAATPAHGAGRPHLDAQDLGPVTTGKPGIVAKIGLSFANNQTVLKGFVCQHMGGSLTDEQSLDQLSRQSCHIVTWSSPISQAPPGLPCNLLARQVLRLGLIIGRIIGDGEQLVPNAEPEIPSRSSSGSAPAPARGRAVPESLRSCCGQFRAPDWLVRHGSADSPPSRGERHEL